MSLRVLLDPDGATGTGAGTGAETDVDLTRLYAAPGDPWLRVNMVATLDGAATGDSGRSGSINNAVDKVVYDHLRSVSHAVVVGAGTARAEGYAPVDRPTVVVSARGDLPELLRTGPTGSVLLATHAGAAGLARARDLLGSEQVLVLGADAVDLTRLKAELAERGLTQLICEGGPHLLRDLLAAGVVDELCASIVPRLVAGERPRITSGPDVDASLRLVSLLEGDSTLLGRWLVGS